MREASADVMTRIVESDENPLAVAAQIAADPANTISVRLSACSIVLPYLFPRLSETKVESKHTVQHIDAAEVLDRIAEKMARVATRPPVIDGVPFSPVGGSTLRQDAAENREKS